MQFQNEKMPSLYRGSGLKPQQLSQGGGGSVLNTANNSPINEVQYNNLPEFQPMNVKLENVPIYNFGTPNYFGAGANAFASSSSNGFGIDIGQLLEASEALFDLWQSNNKRKQNQSNKNQQQNNQNQPVEQNYEFIPPSTYENN